VLVTHSITHLKEVDNIFVLKNGAISEIGTFKELLARKGAFAEIVLQHLQDVEVGNGNSGAGEALFQPLRKAWSIQVRKVR